MSSSNRSNTPTGNNLQQKLYSEENDKRIPFKFQDIGSEMDEDEMMVSESEDSNDSWTTEEFSSEFIMRYGSR